MNAIFSTTSLVFVVFAGTKTAVDNANANTTLKIAIVTSVTTVIVTILGLFGERVRRNKKGETTTNYASPEYIKALVDVEVAEQRIRDLEEERNNLKDALNAKIELPLHKPRKKA